MGEIDTIYNDEVRFLREHRVGPLRVRNPQAQERVHQVGAVGG